MEEMKWSSSGFLGVQLSQTTLVLAWLGLAWLGSDMRIIDYRE